MEKDGVDPASDAYQKMTANLNNAQAEFNKTSREIEGNEQAIVQLNANAKAEKLQKFTSDALKNVGSVAGKAVVVGLKAAAAAMAAVGTAAVAVGAKMAGLVEDTREYRTDLSKLQQNAANASLSFDSMKSKLSGLSAITGETDSSIEALSNLMAAGFNDNQMAAAVEALSGAVIKFPDTLKIESLSDSLQETLATGAATGQFSELIGRMGGNVDEFNKKLAAATTGAERQQVALEWLSKSGLTGVTEEYKKANAAMLSAAEAQFALDDSLASFASTIEPAVASIKGGFASVLTSIVGMLNGSKGASDSFAHNVEGLTDTILKQTKTMLPMVSSFLSAFVKVIVKTLPTILPQLADGAFQVIEGLVSAITENVQPLADMVATLATQLTLFILENLPTLITAAAQILIAIATGIAENLPTLIPAVVQTVLTIANTLIENVGQLIPVALQIIVALIQGITAALPQLIGYLPTIVQTITTTLIDNLPLLLQAAWQIILALGQGLITALPELVKAVPEIITTIVGALGSLASQLWEAGKNIVAGLWQGIQKAYDWLKQKVTGFFKGIIKSVTSFLGIHSPSTVFAGIGTNMALGLGKGFTAAMQGVGKSIRASIPSTSADVAITATGKGMPGTPAAPNLTINTHDTLSPYEILQEYMNFQRRVAWQS